MSNHINANKEDIAKVVIMPGDPNRAKAIADKFLHDVKLVNDVRGILAFTGYTDKRKRVTIMASGMGHPSMGIYSYELYKEYDVDLIIRVGTCGTYKESIKMLDIILCEASSTDSAWASQYGLDGTFSACADFFALNASYIVAKNMGLNVHVGNILSSDVFYDYDINKWKKWAKLNVLGVEMESYALYCNAALLKKKALTILTVTDNFITKEKLPTEDRSKLTIMGEVAIKTAEKFL